MLLHFILHTPHSLLTAIYLNPAVDCISNSSSCIYQNGRAHHKFLPVLHIMKSDVSYLFLVVQNIALILQLPWTEWKIHTWKQDETQNLALLLSFCSWYLIPFYILFLKSDCFICNSTNLFCMFAFLSMSLF